MQNKVKLYRIYFSYDKKESDNAVKNNHDQSRIIGNDRLF